MTPTQQRKEVEVALEANQLYTNYTLTKQRSRVMYHLVKRAMDLISAIIGLVLLAPLFLLVSLIIKLEDPKGSVFFYQTRIGMNEKPFRMYKFRSMVANAEDLLEDLLEQNEIDGAMFKMKEDPRITKIGRFLRKFSIDELPQLWNVIRGEMSLVGPRPPLPREVEDYSSYDKLRLRVTPGCTGLWQVSGRNSLNFQEMIDLDLVYIERRSLWFDTKIILRTVKVIVSPNSAY